MFIYTTYTRTYVRAIIIIIAILHLSISGIVVHYVIASQQINCGHAKVCTFFAAGKKKGGKRAREGREVALREKEPRGRFSVIAGKIVSSFFPARFSVVSENRVTSQRPIEAGDCVRGYVRGLALPGRLTRPMKFR